jgi:nitroreductase
MYEENAVLHALCTRRSVRSYDSTKPVEQEKIQAVLTAGQYAPTGMNRMPTKFVVIRNPEMLHQLSKQNAEIMGAADRDPFYGAPVAILVLVDSTVHTWVEDGSLAMGAMLNAAYAVGLGSCWIHRAREVFASEEGKALKAEWGVPESYVGIGHCVLGYRSGEYPKAKARKDGFVIRV